VEATGHGWAVKTRRSTPPEANYNKTRHGTHKDVFHVSLAFDEATVHVNPTNALARANLAG
jgi:hypothetical protein